MGTWLFFKVENFAEPPHHRKEGSAAGISGNVVDGRNMVILQGKKHYGPLHDVREGSAAGIPGSVGDGKNMVIF